MLLPSKAHLIGYGLLFLSVILLLWRVDSLSKNLETERRSLLAAKAVIKQNETNIKISKEVSDDYQDRIARLDADIRRLRKLEPVCAPISGYTHNHSGTVPGGKFSNRNGISVEWSLDYGARSERTRIKGMACQEFVKKMWGR